MAARILRDDIHGDIPLSALDARVLDDPLLQRLRGVRQSAGAHFVFPTMRVTRFEHSIGVMHLVSRLFRATLVNSSPEVRVRLLDGIAALVDGLPTFDRQRANEGQRVPSAKDLYDVVHQQTVTNGLIAAFDVPARTRAPEATHGRWTVALAVCEQALRLCSLLHDLGHLPFSHDFELAIEEVTRGGPADRAAARVAGVQAGTHLHEKVSIGLSSVLRDRVAQGGASGGDPNQQVFDQASFAMARRLVQAKSDAVVLALKVEAGSAREQVDAGLARWLYSLVDGELDADRADYILRDSAGYTLGSTPYDLSRFLGGLAVVIEGDDQDPRPVTVVTRSGVGAIEAMFLARYRLYSDAVYHHRIQKSTAGLRFSLAFVVNQCESSDLDEFFAAVRELVVLGQETATGQALSNLDPDRQRHFRAAAERFARYDDARMTTLIDGLIEAHGGADQRVAWECFVRRGTDLVTLWKRATEVPIDGEQLPTWRQSVGRRSVSRKAIESLRSRGVLLGFVDAKTWGNDEDGSSELRVNLARPGEDPRLEPLSEHAPLLRGLTVAADLQIEVLAFRFAGNDEVSGSDVAAELLEDAVALRGVAATAPDDGAFRRGEG